MAVILQQCKLNTSASQKILTASGKYIVLWAYAEEDVVIPPVVIHVNPYGKTYEPPPARRGAPKDKHRVAKQRVDLLDEIDFGLRVTKRPFIRVEQRERVRFGEVVTDTTIELVSLVLRVSWSVNRPSVFVAVEVSAKLPTIYHSVPKSLEKRFAELELEVRELKQSKQRPSTDAFAALLELLDH